MKLETSTVEAACQVKDLSYKGAKVAVGMKLPQDCAFKINLRLSEDCAMDLEVWVAWRKVISGVTHYGLYFSKIRDADKDKIYRFINAYYPGELKQRWWPGQEEAQKKEGGADMDDRRIFERFKKQFPARFIDDSGREGLAETLDVSAKGLGLLTRRQLQPAAALEVWVEVSDNKEPLYTRGEVVWSAAGQQGYRAGVELEKADLMGISRFLRA